ncbi:twin-arginine translocase subunit TatC [Haloprofundus salilacus]|uniref:twin-arginine translocase subunit TatC n=1 Tax=Haloprofundus salilacus TaxID=2876190 RepID=UPI001CCE6B34|nr:twin-arginine translocase subunit TatC [Haloprofundus salilacus]
MVLETDSVRELGPRGSGVLLRTARTRARELALLFSAAVTLTLFAFRATGIDLQRAALSAYAPAGTALPTDPLVSLGVELQVAALVGVCVAGAALLWDARSETSPHGARTGRLYLLSAVLCSVGIALGATLVVPALLELLKFGVLRSGFVPAYRPYWLAEVALFLPVAVGIAVSLPALMVALVSDGVVSSTVLHRDWGFALLGVLTYASLYSPPDSATFVVYGGVLIGGHVAGLAVLTFG